jgi:TIGR00255 family protein
MADIMVKSMTGFGRGEYQENGIKINIEIKTVNHRYTDIFVKFPRMLAFLEDKVRDIISKNISRGKIDVFMTYEEFGEDSKIVVIDEALAGAYLKALNTLGSKFELRDDITVSMLSRFPDILRVEKVEEDEGELLKIVSTAVQTALDSLLKMRIVEGAALKASLLEKLDNVLTVVTQIEERAPSVVVEYKEKLSNRLKELLEQKVVDENRIATEVAIFADRCSIDEELVRLKSHIVQFKDTLNLEIPVGRKLDFIVQEMNREINTIGSKANDITITKCVVDVKSEIEKIREQVQNIE